MPVIFNPPSEPSADLTAETRMQRKNTHRFIMADPITLALTPVAETTTAGGGVVVTDQPKRDTQTFRLIPMSHTERPRRAVTGPSGTSSGTQRRHEFTLLGEWDADMQPGDWWDDERGERWKIDEIVPHNGYETRGLVTAFGKTR